MRSACKIATLAGLLLSLGCTVPLPSKQVCAVTEDGFAPKRLAERGIGGTGAPSRMGGTGVPSSVGGTGVPSRLADRGIGGTGAPTGVQGTITGFASICVNGLELAYDRADPVDIDGTAQLAGDLRIGQVVTLRADASADGLVARAIAVRHAVSGPIEAVNMGGLELIVAGQNVRLGANSPGAASLQPGQWVQVSGLRDPGGTILAARVDPRPPGEVFITGRMIGPSAARRIGGAILRGNLPTEAGNEAISVVGTYQNGMLTVRQLFAPTRPLPLGQAGLVVVEAMAQGTKTATGDRALQVGDGMVAAIGPNFGDIPLETILMVLVMEQTVSGELTALSHHDGCRDGGAPATTVAAAVVSLAPHATATTAVGANSAAKAGGAAAAAKAEAASAAGAGGKGSSGGTGSSASGGHGAAAPATK